jgi:hypothetical protein
MLAVAVVVDLERFFAVDDDALGSFVGASSNISSFSSSSFSGITFNS